MIIKVQYTKLKPAIGDTVGVTSDGRIRRVKWKKLIIGNRVKYDGCAKKEIWIKTSFNLPIIRIAGEDLNPGTLLEEQSDERLYCAKNHSAPIGFCTTASNSTTIIEKLKLSRKNRFMI